MNRHEYANWKHVHVSSSHPKPTSFSNYTANAFLLAGSHYNFKKKQTKKQKPKLQPCKAEKKRNCVPRTVDENRNQLSTFLSLQGTYHEKLFVHIHLGIRSAYQHTNSEIRRPNRFLLICLLLKTCASTGCSDLAPLSMSQAELVRITPSPI